MRSDKLTSDPNRFDMPFDISADSRKLGGNFKQSIMKRDNSIRAGWIGEGGTTLKTKET